MRTYFWDFFGPRAIATATHFLKHLDGFLREHALEGCETGTVSNAGNHLAAYCRTPQPHHEAVERALRPRRFEDS